jgi:two-component system LytT family sensor kinase
VSSPAPRRFGTTALWILAASTAAGVALSLRAVPKDRTWEQVLRGSLAFAYGWGALSLPIVALDRRLARGGARPALGLVWHLPGSLLVAALSVYVVPAFATLLAAPGQGFRLSLEPLRQLGRWGLASHMILYWAVVGGSRAVHYYARYQEGALRAVELEKLLVQSQLQALRMQLDPHFLFNALNTISAELERDPRTARRMLEQLGELLRCSLESQDQQEVALAQELKLLDHYLAIQQARFDDRLRIELRVPDDALDARVPSQLLQPLVENALRHGLAQRATGGRLRIEAEHADADLRLRVIDDGVGLPAGGARPGTAGRGLSITRERLARLYPDGRARLEVRNGPESGVVAEVVIPWLTGTADAAQERHGEIAG